MFTFSEETLPGKAATNFERCKLQKIQAVQEQLKSDVPNLGTACSEKQETLTQVREKSKQVIRKLERRERI